MVVLLLIAGMSVFPAYSGKAAALTKPPLTKEDCVKCHPGPPADIATAGGNTGTSRVWAVTLVIRRR